MKESSEPEAILFLSLSLFFFLREECDQFRDEDRSGGIEEDKIEANFILVILRNFTIM